MQAGADVHELAVQASQTPAVGAHTWVFECGEGAGRLEAHNLIDEVGKAPFEDAPLNLAAEHLRCERSKIAISVTQCALQRKARPLGHDQRADSARTHN